METDQEPRRFVCKFCNMSFSNGRVLGGHMRSHMGLNSTKGKKKIENEKVGSEGNDDSGYVLRENPKKSWKFSGSGGAAASGPGGEVGGSVQDNLCQVCGKGFDSPRALFGHLRHHSSKERKSIHCTECGRGFGTLRALTGHMRWHPEKVKVSNGTEPEPSPCSVGDCLSDTEKSGPVRKKRSKRVMRCKNFSNSCSFSDLNDSSSVTETERELEDVAMCLMMLSRGVRTWADYVSVCESSEINSLSFEVKQVHHSKLIVRIEAADESLSVSDSVNAISEKRKFRFCENDPEFGFKKPKQEDLAGLQSVKLSSETKQDTVCAIATSDSEIFDEFGKKKHYRCRICNKSFHSHQALGGHCNGHKKEIKDTQISVSSETDPNCCKLVDYECDETSEEREISSSAVKNSKVHECPVCFKVFRSGQALGGHKRAHFSKGADIGSKDEPYDDQTLSLKVSVDDVDVGFKQWWVGSNYSHEALVTPILS